MSLTIIRNALARHLSASGPWKQNEISTCSFDVLEGANACAIVFFPGSTPLEPMTYDQSGQAVMRRYWGINGTLYIKYSGDPKKLLAQVWRGHDDLYNTLIKDPSLGGTAQAAYPTELSFDISRAIESGAGAWVEIRWGMTVEEY